MTVEERQRRLDRARMAIHAELLVGLLVVILTGYLSIAALFGVFLAPPLMQSFLVAVPVVSLLAWVWMLRLSRPRPEAGERSWRYHDRAW